MKEKTKIVFSKIVNFVKANNKFFIGFIVIAIFFLVISICLELINTSECMFSDTFLFNNSPQERIDNYKQFWSIAVTNGKMLANYFACIFIFLIVYGITNRPRLSCIVTAALVICIEMLNYLVIQARGFAITVSDIYAIKTAISVADGLEFKFKTDVIIAIITLIAAITGLFMLYKPSKSENRTWFKRITKGLILFFIGIIGLLNFTRLSVIDEMMIWDINACYAEYGSTLTIAKLFKDIRVKVPEGYIKEQIEEYISTFENDTEKLTDEEIAQLPNIVVIMNESFADLNLAYNINTRADSISYFHELVESDKTVSGIMHSSKFGGGTSSIEYEFLTQNTTAFLPVGSIPYQQYIKRSVSESIVERFNRLQYETHGIHSYYNTAYSRGKVYRLLGFQDIKFVNDMPDLEFTNNKYATDSSTYKYLYKTTPKEKDDKRDFSFVLTMQNHIAYANDETGKDFYPEDYFTNIYLQEEEMSDDALKELIEYYESVEEDTVILFFGDHQPSINQNELFTVKDGVDEREANYIIPFVIWANYDLNVRKNVETSTNYLQSILYEAARIPTDSYTKYICGLRERIPVITCNYYIGDDGQIYDLKDIESPYYNEISRYEQICYYHLFDE